MKSAAKNHASHAFVVASRFFTITAFSSCSAGAVLRLE